MQASGQEDMVGCCNLGKQAKATPDASIMWPHVELEAGQANGQLLDGQLAYHASIEGTQQRVTSMVGKWLLG